jgi:hypothetical protein
VVTCGCSEIEFDVDTATEEWLQAETACALVNCRLHKKYRLLRGRHMKAASIRRSGGSLIEDLEMPFLAAL